VQSINLIFFTKYMCFMVRLKLLGLHKNFGQYSNVFFAKVFNCFVDKKSKPSSKVTR